jgi:amino acid transporter
LRDLQANEQAAPPPQKRSVFSFLFGHPLSSEENVGERVGPAAGIPIFGLDALSSAAYGPEAALTILIPLGVAGVAHIVPISFVIIVLLGIVFFSYRQTIAAYPHGAGSYTVASENLGAHAGLLAGAALMLDYILNVAVGISAGVGAIVSAVPSMQPHTLSLCLGILAALTLINLRGIREAGVAFMVPTYAFVLSLGGVIIFGLVQAVLHGGHPAPVAPVAQPSPAIAAVSLWLLIRAFASGCTALTGVEAVSNGVQVFRDDRVKNARITLSAIIAILVLMLAGIAFLCRAYGIVATAPGQPGYQMVLSQLAGAVVGRGVLYYITMTTVLLVVALSANTSFADFPRLCRSIAEDGYLPFPFTIRGRRLVFSFGVYALALLAGALLVAFGGVTDRLIPLFAVGAFTAFTLSQAGMVMHWKRKGGSGAYGSMLINGLGALATGITTLVVVVAKFTEGAWLTVLVIPALFALMAAVHRQYQRIETETAQDDPLQLDHLAAPLVVVPLLRWSRVANKALRFAYTLCHDVTVLHIVPEEDPDKKAEDNLTDAWKEKIEQPAVAAGFNPPKLVLLHSPYRFVITPMLDYILDLERDNPNRTIAVVIPELVEHHWWYYLLHNQRAAALKVMLYLKGSGRIVVVNVSWHLEK